MNIYAHVWMCECGYMDVYVCGYIGMYGDVCIGDIRVCMGV